MHQVQREAREGRDRPRDVGDDEDLGLRGPRRLEAQVERHAAGREAAPHGVAQVDRSAAAAAALAREAHGELAAERSQGALELGHLVAIGVHDVEVLGQGLAHRLGQRLGAAILDEPLADLALDLGLELRRCASATSSRASRAASSSSGERPSPSRRASSDVQFEVAQRAVEVVRAADRSTRLHARVPRDRLARAGAHAPRGRRRAGRGTAARTSSDALIGSARAAAAATGPRPRAPRAPSFALARLQPRRAVSSAALPRARARRRRRRRCRRPAGGRRP